MSVKKSTTEPVPKGKQPPRPLDLTLGALWDSEIKEQLDKQHFKYRVKDINHLAQAAKAITRLNLTKIITDKQATKLRKKLFFKVCIHLKKHN